MESRCPEVHPNRLCFVHVIDSLDARGGQMADLMSINREGDVVWRPLHLVSMPVIMWNKMTGIVMVFQLIVTISENHSGPHRILVNRGDNLDIELIPSAWVEVRPIPVRKERGNGALTIRGLHPRHELSICEFLVAGDRAALPVGVGHSGHTQESCYKLHHYKVGQILL